MYILKLTKNAVIKITTLSGEKIRIKIADSQQYPTRLAFDTEKEIDIKIEKTDESSIPE